MTLALRPHHFLCLPGYKGYNYNQAQKTSWDTISQQLKENPDTDILIKSGRDDLCKKCPNDGSGYAICRDDSVDALDKKVQDLIGIETGKTYKFSEIMRRMREVMTPQIHEKLCSTCTWWTKGLCRDTFEPQNPPQKAPFLSVTTGKTIDPSTLRFIPPKKQEAA